MARSTYSDRLKRFLGIEPDHTVDDSLHYDGHLYVESEPSVKQFLVELFPTIPATTSYIKQLFPFWSWIFHYNLTWLLGDFIAGVTVGFVVVPQGMAYALLANLPPEYGLYTSFVGFLLYWAFATSKDITIGAVAVMSTIVGNITIDVQKTHPHLAPETVARTLALISGMVLLFLGLIRAGFIVEFIPLVAIGSFMTGSALNIAAGQVPGLMGISGVNTRDSTYLVIINTLKALRTTKLDAAMGLTALFALYFIRWFCGFMGRRYPKRAKTWFFVSTLRMAFVVILYILVSWLVNRNVSKASQAKFKILGPVPSGFQHAGAPQLNAEILSALGPNIPTTILVLLIEHIAISKSFGRVNNYIINPSQELVAIGFTNVFGPFLGGYPATGSFSRTAIKAKAGVRTPLAGIFTAVIVLLALYALTSVFFYIPTSGLAAIIIHAVGDLISPPREVYKYWKTSPPDFVIFFAGVFVSVFTSIENGIYTTVCASAAVLLFRVAKSPGRFLGKVRTRTVPRDSLGRGGAGASQEGLDDGDKTHTAYIPLDRSDLSNPEADIRSPYPGVFIYRFGEGLNYVNSGRHLDKMTIYILEHTRRTQLNKFEKIGDRPWNDPGPHRRGGRGASNQPTPAEDDELAAAARRPTLRALVLDFSAVSHLDVTAAQALADLRGQLDRHAAPDRVEWHFAGVASPWARRALVASGFGPSRRPLPLSGVSVAESSPGGGEEEEVKGDGKEEEEGAPLIGVAEAAAAAGTTPVIRGVVGGGGRIRKDEFDTDKGVVGEGLRGSKAREADLEAAGGVARVVPLYGVNRPFFHVDVETAVTSAVANLERRGADLSA